jgi:RNA recognition motif-containing protein
VIIGEKHGMETKLYVGNLSYEITENDLRNLFTQAGTVNEVALYKDRDLGGCKGFAEITMHSQKEANRAIKQFNGYNLSSRELKVNIAHARGRSFDSNL